MCVKILFFPLEDQRSWRQFKIGKVLVHFHLKLISSHCRGEKPYWQCKKHTALLTLYPSFPSPHPSFCFNFYFLCMGVLSACVSVYHVHNLGQQGRKFRNNRHKYKKKNLGLGRLFNLVETHQQQPPENPSYLFYKSELRRWVCCVQLNEEAGLAYLVESRSP